MQLATKQNHPCANPRRGTCIPDNRESKSGWLSFRAGIEKWSNDLTAHAKRECTPSAMTKALYADARDNLQFADAHLEDIALAESSDPRDFETLLTFAELECEVREDDDIDRFLAADDAPGNLRDKSAAWCKSDDVDAEFDSVLFSAWLES